ncbi:MAG: IS110 family transposase [Rhizobiaceae bacterium]|nr:IS110 family transposase [Alphaproteobacteria bacterium]MCB1468331.1 IS110 family transposase [Rhizobiaceae bacterium]
MSARLCAARACRFSDSIWPEIIERLERGGKQVELGRVGDAINARLVAAGHNLCIVLTTPALLRPLKPNAMARLFKTALGVDAVIALSIASTYEDASRFYRSSRAGAYLGLTPRRYGSGEISRSGCTSKRGDKLARTPLYEAANVILTGQTSVSSLND